MLKSKARIETQQGQRFCALLSKHWSHRFPVVAEPRGAVIDFGDSFCHLTWSESGLDIVLEAPLSQMKGIEDTVVDHVQRYMPKGETLVAAWSREDEV